MAKIKRKKFKSVLLENDIRVIKFTISKLVDMFFEHALSDIKYPLKDYKKIKVIDEKFSPDGIGDVDKLLKIISLEIFDQAIYKNKPEYLKFVDNGASIVNVEAAVINSLLNQNLTAHLTDSPGATFHEIALIRCVRELVGFPVKNIIKSVLDVGGYFASGGMMGNMAALLVARNSLQPDAQTNGVLPNVKLIVPAFAAHYSTWNAMGWLGFGDSNVVHVKTKNFCYDLVELERSIIKTKSEGSKILAVVASLGDPYSMKVENILKVREVCDKYGIWLHGDGANCGTLIFSNRYRKCINHIELCDSITLDPHKILGLNYPISIFLCKDIEKFNSVASHWNIINRKDSFDLGIITPFLNSRGFDSLKLWILLKYFGLNGVAKIIDNKIDATNSLREKLSMLGNNIKFWNSSITFSILFQVIPNSLQKKGEKHDDDYFNKLGDAQEKFKNILEDTSSIGIHGFKLPISIGFKNSNSDKLISVLCIQNAHEKIPNYIIRRLNKVIEIFCSNN